MTQEAHSLAEVLSYRNPHQMLQPKKTLTTGYHTAANLPLGHLTGCSTVQRSDRSWRRGGREHTHLAPSPSRTVLADAREQGSRSAGPQQQLWEGGRTQH